MWGEAIRAKALCSVEARSLFSELKTARVQIPCLAIFMVLDSSTSRTEMMSVALCLELGLVLSKARCCCFCFKRDRAQKVAAFLA